MKEGIKLIARNKKASHNYFILDTLEVGISLTGTEIKSVRAGNVSINEAYVEAKNGCLKIINMHISSYKQGNIFNHNELRERMLLAHKREILKLENKVKLESMTLIPLDLYLKRGYAKITLGLCKGKKNYDKRESLKEEDLSRDEKRYGKR